MPAIGRSTHDLPVPVGLLRQVEGHASAVDRLVTGFGPAGEEFRADGAVEA